MLPIMMAVCGLLIPLFVMAGVGVGYPTGAPERACSNMTPRHNDAVAMDTNSPYMLLVEDSTVSPGGVITVTLNGTVGFRGFLLQARWTNGNSIPVGAFTPNDGEMMTLTCSGRRNGALTHTNSELKTAVQAVWRAPRNRWGSVHFIAAVVKSLEEYWMEVTSLDVMVIETTTVDFTTVDQSTVLSTTSSPDTTVESTTEFSPTTTGELFQQTEHTSEETASSDSTESSTSSERLETTQILPAHVTQSTTQSASQVTMPRTVDTPSSTTVESTISVESTTPLRRVTSSTYDLEMLSTGTQSGDVTVDTTRELHQNETDFNESTTLSGTTASNETHVVSELSTASDFYTTQPSIENSTTLPTFSDFETSSSTLETPTPSQYDNTTVFTANTTLTEALMFEPSNESSTLATEIPTSTNLSTEMTSSVTPFDNSSLVNSTSAFVEQSTTFSDANATEQSTHTSTAALTSTEPLIDSSTYFTSTSQPNKSTTLSSNTSTSSTPSTPSTTAPVKIFTTLLSNVSSTEQVNISDSTDDGFLRNATESPLMTSSIETPVENSTMPITTQNTTEVLETPTTNSSGLPTTTEESIGETEFISTSLTPSSGSTSVSTRIGSTIGPPSTTTSSGSTTQSMTTESSTTSESTTNRPTTSGSTTDFFTTESVSTHQSTLLQSTEASTTPMVATSTEQQQINPEVSTADVVIEEANEIRMRMRIEGIPFTEDFNNPASESFRSIARQIEQEVSELYEREGVTMIESVRVLKITRGSIVPEIQILTSVDLDESTKSAWLNVMYNEVQSTGSLGNFTVSDVSALTADGTFVEVDPCFLLPCPPSMVCYVFQTNCFSNCYLNGNYCLNDGVCQEPTADNQLASCRCDSRHEGDRCEVRKAPVSPPPNGKDNSHVIVAAVWGSIGSVSFVLIIIFSTWLLRYRRRKQRWRHTAKLMGNTETGGQNRAQMDSYARRLSSIRAGVLIDLANISVSGSEADSTDTGRQLSRSTSFSYADSNENLPRFVEGGVHIGAMPDILQGASTTDYEMDFMNRPLSQKRKSVSFNDVTEMIDFVATENFTLGNPEGGNGNFQVRWDFQVDRSESRESSS